MADSKRSLDVIVAAKDDTAAGLASASRRFSDFRRRMQQEQAEKAKGGGLAGMLPGFAIAALSIQTLANAAEAGDEQMQKYFDHTVTGSEALQQTLANTAMKLPGVESVFKPLAGLVGTLTAGIMELNGASHSAAQQNLFNAFNYKKETEAIVGLSEGAAQAAKDLHELAGDIGLKGLEKQFREIDKQIADRVKASSAAAQAVLANPDASADQREAANKALDRIAEEGENARAAAKAEAQKQNNQTEVDRERLHQLDLAQIGAEGRAAALVEAGRDADAAVALLKQKYDRMATEEKARADQEARENPERAAEIESMSAKKIEEIQQRRDQDIAINRRNVIRQEIATEYGRASDIGDIQATITAQRLRTQHRESEAALVELSRSHEKEMQEIDRQTQEKTEKLNQVDDAESQRKITKELAAANARKAALEGQFGAQSADLQRQAQEEAATRQETIEHNIAQLRLSGLKEQAEMGNKIAEVEAQRLEKLEKYAEHKRDILRMLREEKDLTDEQRKQLNEELKNIDAKQAKAAKGLAAGAGQIFTTPTLPEAQEGRGLTGLAQANREAILDDSRRQAVAQIETAKQSAIVAKEVARLREIAENMLRGTVWNIIPVS